MSQKNSNTKIIVAGACGRMGMRILELADQGPYDIVGAVEAKGHPQIGVQLPNLISGISANGVQVSDSLSEQIGNAEVVIDFTHPDVTMEHIRELAGFKKGIVIGTTGFSKAQLEEVQTLSKKTPVVLAPNMSVGVNIVFQLSELLGKLLDEEYDVEIIETHHRFKNDAPSGTALELAKRVAAGREVDLDEMGVYGRKGFTGERKKGSIGVHALRGGDIVGEHTVRFLTQGETIEISHRASSRDSFASGALRAAQFLSSKKSGFYTMKDVLGLK